jgi:PPM family protein phosphatase
MVREMSFGCAMVSECGRRRENQDRAAIAEADGHWCWVVADGLGGHGGGERAAAAAVQAVLDAFKAQPASSEEAVLEYFRAANAAVAAERSGAPALSGMRTTLALALSDRRSLHWGHAGDSRVYLFRQGRVAAQTQDHSVPQAMAAAGEIRSADIRFHEDHNRLTRSIGGDGEARPSTGGLSGALAAGDALLLCSDGFWEPVTEREMEVELAKAVNTDAWLEGMNARLRTRLQPDSDNFTAIAVLVD